MNGYDSFSEQTEDWKKYTRGVSYNNTVKPNYYATVDTNIAMYSGDQWRNVQANGMPTPVFNIIKRAVSYFVATLTTNTVAVLYEPLAYSDDNPDPQAQNEKDAADIASSEINNLFNKFRMENRIRDALTDAAVMGDACCHIYFDKTKKPYGGAFTDVMGEICFELVDGTNVYFGNANNPNVEIQPYIIISGRDMVENLKDEAKLNKQNQVDIDSISEDKLYEYQAGDMGRIEITGDEYGKALYIIIYKRDKKTGTVKVSKCTENVYIYKDIDTGLKEYPIAWLNWEKQKNQYHGRAVSTGMIPNQIFINRMFAMVMYNLMMTAFPKAVYDADRISGWSNEMGTAIPLNGLNPGENIMNAAGYLNPGNMSGQIVQVIELAMQYTKESMGINDAMTGSMKALNYRAIVAMQQAAQVPLQNPKANLHEWMSSIGRILLDMMGTYYGVREIVVKNKDTEQIEKYDFNQLKNIWLNVKTDVGDASYWSEIAQVETLDNLLKEGAIQVIEYLEALPDGYLNDKQELIDAIKARVDQQMQAQQAQQPSPGQIPGQQPQQQDNSQLYEQMAKFVESLPQEVQARLEQIRQSNPQVYEETVMKLMQNAQGGSMT